MIALEDCIALCGLSEQEVLAIAEHEHMPEVAAASLAHYLLNRADGPQMIRDMIIEDVQAAQARCDIAHMQSLLHVLSQFLRDHPDALLRPQKASAA